MREINLDRNADVLPVNTFLIYGDSRSGKTTLAASFPRPLFLADASEGGWDSIANMTDDQYFEPTVKPLVWAIEKMNDMAEARAKALPLIQAGRVKTIVIDSISFYADLYLNYLIALQTKRDTRAAYGDLGLHLRDLRVQLHGLGCNVVWLALARSPEPDDPMGRPMIPGQQADKLMAGCHYIMYARHYQERKNGVLAPSVYELRTQRYAGFAAGNRLGAFANDLPDPFIGNYATFLDCIGYDADAIRRTLPPLNGVAKPVAAPRAAAPAARPPTR
jgi:hypothetical protein